MTKALIAALIDFSISTRAQKSAFVTVAAFGNLGSKPTFAALPKVPKLLRFLETPITPVFGTGVLGRSFWNQEVIQ